MNNIEGKTYIKQNQGNIKQYGNYFEKNNPKNYHQKNYNEINSPTFNNVNRNLNIDNNIDNNIAQNAQRNYKKAQEHINQNNQNEFGKNFNPPKELNSKNKRNEKKISNNNKNNKDRDFEKFVTPGGEDEQDLLNYYKYVYNENTEIKKNNNNNNPFNQNEKEENELNINPPFSLNEYKKACLVAIENVGNTSYMSAIIRILANNKHLVKYYLTELNKITNYLQEIPLTYAFSRIIFHLYPFPQDSLKKSISIDNFYRTALLLNPSFRGKSTKNGIDFLNFLLDTLHSNDKVFRNQYNIEENKNIIKNQDIQEYAKYLDKYEKSIIFNNFAWINQKVRKCNTCEEESISYHYFFTYDVNILNSFEKIVMNDQKDDINIFDCIKEESNKKRLHNIFCYKCKNKGIFDEKNTIYSSPYYFIFLIRLNEEETINKIRISNKKIRIDVELNLNTIINGQQKNYLYEPIGKVDYCFNSKEYITSCRDPIDNNWYKYENSQYKISKVNFTESYENYDVLPVIVVYKIKKSE